MGTSSNGMEFTKTGLSGPEVQALGRERSNQSEPTSQFLTCQSQGLSRGPCDPDPGIGLDDRRQEACHAVP